MTKQTGIDLSTSYHRDTRSTSDVVLDMLSNDEIATRAESLIKEFESSLGQGLLARLDEPQMMTPLWDHQLEALRAWKAADYRGYADMATATGKTVLGLAALALRYGSLHPVDDLQGNDPSDSRQRVLIVAHSDLILEQWRREFDRHLNIPEERTHGSDDISLTWGDIHFRTPQHLLNQGRYPYDLVILDEAHHYATSPDWGDLLERFEEDVIALSGSVDDAGTDSQSIQERLKSKIGPEIKRYSISEAQNDGVIPAFDWEVRYAPFNHDDEFVEISKSAKKGFENFRRRVDSGDYDIGRRVRTFDDIRAFSHSSLGKELKRSDEDFRELSTTLFSRRTKRWHLSPRLEAICEIAEEHTNDHVLVLADSNSLVEQLFDELSDRLPGNPVTRAGRDQSRVELRDQLDEFNDAEEGGILIGTGDLLGEGVDIPEANVAVNMATGGVNPQLVQRIGRILRNPSGNKHAHFYNVVGLPSGDSLIAQEDGRRMIEQAGEFCALGARFQNLPGFAAAECLEGGILSEHLLNGVSAIEDLSNDGQYDLPEDPVESELFQGLLETAFEIDDSDPESILAKWNEYSWIESARLSDQEDTHAPLAGIDLEITGPGGMPLSGVEVSVETDLDGDLSITRANESVWTLKAPIGESLTIVANHPDFEKVTSQINTADDQSEFCLELGQPTLPSGFELRLDNQTIENLKLLVHDEAGRPVEDAAVSVVGDSSVEYGRTGADGCLEVSRHSAGSSIRVGIRHPDRGHRSGELTVPEIADVEVTLCP